MSFGEKVELKSNQLELDYEVFLTLVPMENNTSKNFFLKVSVLKAWDTRDLGFD